MMTRAHARQVAGGALLLILVVVLAPNVATGTRTSLRATASGLSLNEIGEKARDDIDDLEIQCKDDKQELQQDSVALASKLAQVTSDMASNVAMQSRARANVERVSARWNRMRATAEQMEKHCAKQSSFISQQKVELTNDVKTAKVMIKEVETTCGGSASLLQTTVSHATLRSHALQSLRKSALGFSTTYARHAVTKAFKHTTSCGRGRSGSLLSKRIWPGQPDTQRIFRRMNGRTCKDDNLAEVTCGPLLIELKRMTGRLEDQEHTLVDSSLKRDNECAQQAASSTAQEVAARRILETASEDQNRVMSTLQDVGGQRDAARNERLALTERIEAKEKECKQDLDTLRGQMSSTLTARDESSTGTIQDCAVSEWIVGPCSQECALAASESSGYATGTRAVLLSPGPSGMACPSLTKQFTCGAERCATDCQMSEWGYWSGCTTTCGGGMQTRQRDVMNEANYGGAQCGVGSQSRMCNVATCDVECDLAPWTPWTKCSRACRVSTTVPKGRQFSERGVVKLAEGVGFCPHKYDNARLKIRRCNDNICPATVNCKGARQLVVLLDGSDTADYDTQLAVVTKLAQLSTAGQVSIGVVVYGGNGTILSPITGDLGGLVSKLTGSAPGGDPNLATAGVLARDLFQTAPGGDSVERELLVITDASPSNFREAQSVMKIIRDMGVNIVLALLDDKSRITRRKACGLASVPCSANVEAFSGWQEMSANPEETVKRIITAVCDIV